MEIDEIKSMWKNYDEKLERSWQLNLKLLRNSNLDKAKSKLRSILLLNVFTLGLSFLLQFGLLSFIWQHSESLHYVCAAAILICWLGLVSYSAIQQLKMILEMDYAAPVLQIQKRLLILRLAILKYFRLTVLIIPLYIAFMIVGFELIMGFDIYTFANPNWWWSQVILSIGVFFPLTLWLYKKLSPKHIDKVWVGKLIGGSGGKQIVDALELLQEIKTFEGSKGDI